MGAKIAAFLLTVTACITAAVISMSVLVIAMNGYSESDAIWGLGAFAILAFLVLTVSGVASVFLAAMLLARQFSIVKSLLIAVPVCSIFGAILVFVCGLIGIGVAEFVRVNF